MDIDRLQEKIAFFFMPVSRNSLASLFRFFLCIAVFYFRRASREISAACGAVVGEGGPHPHSESFEKGFDSPQNGNHS